MVLKEIMSILKISPNTRLENKLLSLQMCALRTSLFLVHWGDTTLKLQSVESDMFHLSHVLPEDETWLIPSKRLELNVNGSYIFLAPEVSIQVIINAK